MIFNQKKKQFSNRSLWFLVAMMLSSQCLVAQMKLRPKEINSDVEGAVQLRYKSLRCLQSPDGYGQHQELRARASDSTSLEQEHHSIWYRFVAQENCELSFLIKPDNPHDDYDFMLFTVQQSGKDSLKTLRVNKARTDSIRGFTGLNSRGKRNYVGEGPGNAFSSPVNTMAGQVFYLLVDNVYENGSGHTLLLNYQNCQSNSMQNHVVKRSYHLSLTIMDKETKQPLEADVLLIKRQYPLAPDTILQKKAFHLFSPLDSGFYYKVFVQSQGYLSQTDEFKVYPFDTLREMEVMMQAVTVGKKIKLDKIFFPGGSSVFLRKSIPSLKKLAQVMQDNPTLVIEIQGHVHLPKPRPRRYKDSYYMDLSEARAKAVYDYLIKRGISKKRLSYKGMSHYQMVFPNAQTSWQQQQNRRVEIVIIEV
jgi:outer membrane protein OmpA-like peptidoglycan-associated protein